jgi:hypothetical protein
VIRRLCLALCLALAPAPALAQAVSPLLYPTQSIADVIQYAVPSSGGTVACDVTTSALVLNNAGLLATLSVTLPPTPVDGQRIIITSGAGVTVLTVTGGTIKGLITTLAINGYARYIYSAAAGAWFRTG